MPLCICWRKRKPEIRIETPSHLSGDAEPESPGPVGDVGPAADLEAVHLAELKRLVAEIEATH